MADDMIRYYALRAAEYEKIYEKPERQEELSVLRRRIEDDFVGEDVLEIACGTGYWTKHVSVGARSIMATDINREVLDIARSKAYPGCHVSFLEADAYYLPQQEKRFTAAICAFWLSHVRRDRIRGFLEDLHTRLRPNALVLLTDNVFAEGSSTPVSRIDTEGNTFQLRTLSDGTQIEVLKNFFTYEELSGFVQGISRDLRIDRLNYYWMVRYRVN